jgi:hypothetical protein
MIAKISAAHNGFMTSADVRGFLRAPLHHCNAVVELIGIEPTTPCLQSRCSPS